MKKYIIGGLITLLVVIGVLMLVKAVTKSQTFGLTRPSEDYLFNAQIANRVSMSYDGTTDEIITDTAHGLVVGDTIRFETASAAIDAGFAEATNYFVITASTSTAFEVSTIYGGTVVDIADAASAGGGEFFMESMKGVRNVDSKTLYSFTLNAEETPSGSVKFFAGLKGSEPNPLTSQSYGNSYDYIDVIDAQDGSSIDGDTGISFTGADGHRLFYIDDARTIDWIGAVIENFASGSFTIRLDTQ